MATENEAAGADTFPKLLLRNAQERGSRPAFREKSRGIWRTTTWRELSDEVAAIAAALSARGLKRGAHVVLLGDNRPRLYAVMCAAQWLGAVAVPLYQDAVADEIAEPLQSAEVTHVFAENQEQVDKILAILPRCPSIRCIIYDKDRGMRHYKQPFLVSYAALLQEGRKLAGDRRDALQAEVARGAGHDAAFLIFTSGTTGAAKGVVLTHASLIDRAGVVAAMEGMSDSDVVMAYLPPGWIGQNLFGYVQPMVVGYCVCCPESSETMLADMREIGPTYFLATPRVLEALLTQVTIRLEETGGFNEALFRRGVEAAQRIRAGHAPSLADRLIAVACDFMIYSPLRDVLGLSRIRAAYVAGDAVNPDLFTYFRVIGINLKQLYGSTETGFFVSVPRDGQVQADTAGPAVAGVELKLSPEREILVRSPGLFKEYHRKPEATAQARDAEGWFRTGDAGYLGEDGHLRVIDRIGHLGTLKDGSTFAPRLLESRLKFFVYIKEAVVFGAGNDTVCALIDIDPVAAGRWADRRVISYTGHADLASRDEIYGLIAGCIEEVNAGLARDPVLAGSQIHRFAIVQTEFSADGGVLTRTGKLRRGVVAERNKPLIDAIGAGLRQARLGPEPGASDAAAVEIKILDVTVHGAAKAGRAA